MSNMIKIYILLLWELSIVETIVELSGECVEI